MIPIARFGWMLRKGPRSSSPVFIFASEVER
jgi:hypothetical protein